MIVYNYNYNVIHRNMSPELRFANKVELSGEI